MNDMKAILRCCIHVGLNNRPTIAHHHNHRIHFASNKLGADPMNGGQSFLTHSALYDVHQGSEFNGGAQVGLPAFAAPTNWHD